MTSNLNKIRDYWIEGCLVTAKNVQTQRRTWRRRGEEKNGFQLKNIHARNKESETEEMKVGLKKGQRLEETPTFSLYMCVLSL